MLVVPERGAAVTLLYMLTRRFLEALEELFNPRPMISRPTLRAAVRRQEMDRHPVEDMEPHAALGVPLRPGDVRKRPTFGRQA